MMVVNPVPVALKSFNYLILPFVCCMIIVPNLHAQQEDVLIPSNLLMNANDGDAEAQFLIGEYLDEGQLFGREVREAFRWIKQSADQGYAPAEHAVGLMYINGRGVPQNFEAGENYLLRASVSGFSSALLSLGEINLQSNNYEQSYLLLSLAVALAENEDDFNTAVEGRNSAEEQLDVDEIRTLQRLAAQCVETSFTECALALSDLDNFENVVEESRVQESISGTSAEVGSQQNQGLGQEAVVQARQPASHNETQNNIPSNCVAIDSDFTTSAEIGDKMYKVYFSYSNIPAFMTEGIALDLGLEIKEDLNRGIIYATGEVEPQKRVDDLSVNIFGSQVALEEVIITTEESETQSLSISLLMFQDFLVQLNYPDNRFCLFDRSEIDLREFQNIEIDIIPSTSPVVLVEFENEIEAWLRLDPTGFLGDITIDRQLARFLQLENQQSEIYDDDYMMTQIDYLKLGPYELGGIEVLYPREGVQSNLTQREQSRFNTNIRRSRTTMGIISSGVMSNFNWLLDVRLKRGYIEAPQ